MDSKNRKNLDVKYLHPFSSSPSHNGHSRNNTGAEGKIFFYKFLDSVLGVFETILDYKLKSDCFWLEFLE